MKNQRQKKGISRLEGSVYRGLPRQLPVRRCYNRRKGLEWRGKGSYFPSLLSDPAVANNDLAIGVC